MLRFSSGEPTLPSLEHTLKSRLLAEEGLEGTLVGWGFVELAVVVFGLLVVGRDAFFLDEETCEPGSI